MWASRAAPAGDGAIARRHDARLQYLGKAVWGRVTSISLVAATTMAFAVARCSGEIPIAVALAPRSLYVLTGDASTHFSHAAPQNARTRYSVSFRTFPPQSLREAQTLRDSAVGAAASAVVQAKTA